MAAFPQDGRKRSSFWVYFRELVQSLSWKRVHVTSSTSSVDHLGSWVSKLKFRRDTYTLLNDHKGHLGTRSPSNIIFLQLDVIFNSLLKSQIFPCRHKHMPICASNSKRLYCSRCWLFMFCEIKSPFHSILSKTRNCLQLKAMIMN